MAAANPQNSLRGIELAIQSFQSQGACTSRVPGDFWNSVPWDQLSFTHVGRLDVLSVEQFTALGRPAFPAYSVMIKRADPTVFTRDPMVK